MKRSTIFLIIRLTVLIILVIAAFYIGKKYAREETMPIYGTIFCGDDLCEKELGPVFYTEKQCEIVIKALSERDQRKRACVQLIN